MISSNFKLIFLSGNKINKEIEVEINKSYKQNLNFFGKDCGEITIQILNIREELDKICNRKTEIWEVGYSYRKDNKENIAIFNPSIFEKVSNHPKSDFSYILTHEIAHVFIRKIFGFYYPKWLNEGVAGYVAKQYLIRPVKKINKFSEL